MTEPKKDTKKKTTSIAQWSKLAKKKNEEVTLPSGAQVVLRRLALLEEAAQGHISMTLVNGVTEYAKKATDSNLTEKDLKSLVVLANNITILATVDPVVTEENIEKIPFDDRMFIFTWINSVPGADTFEPFREE